VLRYDIGRTGSEATRGNDPSTHPVPAPSSATVDWDGLLIFTWYSRRCQG